jgi:transposase
VPHWHHVIDVCSIAFLNRPDVSASLAQVIVHTELSWAQLQHVEEQLRHLKVTRAARERDLATPTRNAIAQLQTLRAIGPIGAWVLATEVFGWRHIRSRRQLGALVGLVPAPYKSGETEHDQGITHAGNAHVRRVIVQLAWGWLHYQPTSALSQWYQHRFGSGSKRIRKLGSSP